MITYEEYQSALNLCKRYLIQINQLAEQVNEDINLIQSQRSEFISNLSLDSELKNFKFISGMLKNRIKIFADQHNIEINTAGDLLKIDISDFSDLKSVGKKTIRELIEIQNELRNI